jgi:acetyltransferase-like isoleucine patch superfamily enzyme
MMNLLYLLSKVIKKLHFFAVKNSTISALAKVGAESHIVSSVLGRYSYIGNNCTVIQTEVGTFCSIADNSIIGGAAHPIDWVSTSPVFHAGKNILKKNFAHHSFNAYKKTIICNDVWVGSNSIIKSGVTINNGAIIGMGSIVTKDIGPYEIWAGNPAKFIKKRFDEETIEKLLVSEWWNYNEEKLEKISHLFNNVNEFIGKSKVNKR